MTARRLDIRIDTLVLRGFTPGQRDAVAAGLRAELSRLLAGAGDGAFGQDRSLASLRLGEIRVATGLSAQRLGRVVAGRVVEGIRR